MSFFGEQPEKGTPIKEQVAAFIAAEHVTTEEQPMQRPVFILAPKVGKR